MGTPRSNLKKRQDEIEALTEVWLTVGEGDGRELPAVVTTIVASAKKPKKRGHNRTTERLYSRVREISPRNVSLKEFCQRADASPIPFPVPKYLREQGCPDTWVRTWKEPKWKRKLHDLKQHAWQNA